MSVKNKRQLYRYAVDLFIETLENITKKRVRYKCNDADVGAFDRFCEEYDLNIIGEDFIRKFLQYGFQSWFNTGNDTDYSRRVRFSWMFGAAAIKRYRVFDPDTNVRIVQGHIKKLGIYKPKIKREETISELIIRLRPYEENFKRSYHNTKRGLAWCVANTTLFHHRSSLCASCVFKTDCKETLKQQFPKVYIKRGYGEK